METANFKGMPYAILGVWHYSTKAVVLLDVGLCFFVKTDGLYSKCVKIVAMDDVPKISKQVLSVFSSYQKGTLKGTEHSVIKGHSTMNGYQAGVIDGLTNSIKK